ncbi:Dexh-box atp-dependent rna helicase dexh4 protein, partial [Thalictrum thalictroides]
MAPKKKQQQQQQKKKQTQKASSSSSSSNSSATPKLQISEENEQRLRRLLLNNSIRPVTSPSNPPTNTISKSQLAKRIRTIYDKLSREGFAPIQIEQSLSALAEGATFEAALDWLCLNLPGNELPLKFSSGSSLSNEGGSISIISTAREDWVRAPQPCTKDEIRMADAPFRSKGRIDDDTLDMRQPSQADWIKQYVEQQEEDEWENLASDGSGGSLEEVVDSSSRADSIAKEYHIARLEATDAKEKKDKKRQELAGTKIRKLKQQMSDLGLSDEILELGFGDESSYCLSKEAVSDLNTYEGSEMIIPCGAGVELSSISDEIEPTDSIHSSALFPGSDNTESEEPDVELSALFSEDASANETLPAEVLKQQKKEKIVHLSGGHNLEKIDGIWKKGDPQKIPKAVLQQLCQKLGWNSPKFTKLPAIEKGFSYSVSILRTASGRGKSKKAGGLVTLQLPDPIDISESTEDAQNRVAAFALYRLFTEYPVDQLITEPYSSHVMKWMEGDSQIRIEDSEETRRASFVDSLLSSDDFASSACLPPSFAERPVADHEKVESVFTDAKVKRTNNFKVLERDSQIRIEDSEETRRASFVDSLLSSDDFASSACLPPSFAERPVADHEKVESVFTDAKVKRTNNFKVLESTNLRREQENKMGLQRYKEMLNARAALPIAELRDEILSLLKENDVLVVCGETGCGKTTQEMLNARAALPIAELRDEILSLLKENDVLVVCGETGCGKTTQVPQFILDDMIKAGFGGYCNIICTQPRRIAAISVAERVADERCEPPPGSDGSLVGFQVRHDSARNERTKLLFCTTGILLRKIAGDKSLADVTHVIVDEVHERSLLGDFLLVILKNLIENQSVRNTRKLKVILMSATVNSSLFSSYFANCPVLTAQGRTHPVSTCFLEDIYESLEYCLASDSPASLRHNPPTKEKGDKSLADVTHVIVDEVHERSLLGDFLLVILKNLIENQSVRNTRKLKVILMSATVNSSLFSSYFANCPVLTAQGRTHPVSTCFLEDIYESLEYCLASDSPASLRHNPPTKEKLHSRTIDNHRGKKNLVLSSWGDDTQLYENYVNPNYDSNSYRSYSERTRENLKALNEDVIDYDLLEDLVCHIDETYPAGAILVFLPGVAEIYMLLDRLLASYQFGGNSSDWLLPLHSSLASIDQKRVFLSPPEDIRK